MIDYCFAPKWPMNQIWDCTVVCFLNDVVIGIPWRLTFHRAIFMNQCVNPSN